LARQHGIYGLSADQIAAKRGAVIGAAHTADLKNADPFSLLVGDANVLGIKLQPLLRELAAGSGADAPILSDFMLEVGDAPNVTGFFYDWNTASLKKWPDGDDGFQFVPSANTVLKITGGVKIEIAEGATAEGLVDGSLDEFLLSLKFAGNGIEIPFRRA